MVIPDTNILLYAFNTDATEHEAARTWWKSALEGDETVGLPWAVILGFIRIGTNSKMFPNPLTLTEATEAVKLWLTFPNVRILNPTEDHLGILTNLMSKAGVGPKHLTDSHLAAIAIENRATLVSHDSDFQNYTGFRLYDPITTK